MFHWLKLLRNRKSLPLPRVDIHSHLLPGLDDGVKTFEEAAQVVMFLSELGYRKLVVTPHVMADMYRNTDATIIARCEELVRFLAERKINVRVEPSAEYYLDETLVSNIEANQQLLTIAGQYLLFETNFLNEPLNLKQFIFLAMSKGYKPILAHPERYLYMDLKKAEDLINRGVLFQLNLTSLTGYYSKGAQVMAHKLIDQKMVHWLGSDCHHMTHATLLKDVVKNRYFEKALNLPLLNNSIE